MEMTNKELKCFSNDILDLYCRTGLSEVESIFIKLAAVEPNLFWKWLVKNEKIRNNLHNSIVYDAMNMLARIRNQYSYGQPIPKSFLMPLMFANEKIIPIINSMYALVDHADVKDVLQQYRDIIEPVCKHIPMEPVNVEALLQDINLIRSSYYKSDIEESGSGEKTRRESIPEKRLNMFKYLLTKFSDDIANAAESSGMPELATAVRSGMLAKPVTSGLNKFMDFERSNMFKIDACKKWAEYILKKPHYDPQWGDYNHDAIETFLMRESGNLTRQEVLDIISKYEETTDPLKFMDQDNKDTMYPGLDTKDKISIDKRLNPSYIFLLSTFFIMLRAKTGLPTGFMTNVSN